MEILLTALEALIAFCLFCILLIALLAMLFDTASEIGHREVQALLTAKVGRPDKGTLHDWIAVPPKWLRLPRWLSQVLEHDNVAAGRRFNLNGTQLTAWVMLDFKNYVLAAAVVITAGIPVYTLIFSGGTAWRLGLLGAIMCLLLGVYFEWGFVRDLRRIARDRLQTIRQQLPYTMDMFVLVLDAGGQFDTALEAFGAFGPEGPTKDEVVLMLQESRAGATRDEMLARFAHRNPISEIDRLALVIRQGEKMGTPLADVLRAQAELLRAERLQRATATAEKMAIDSRLWLAGVVLAIMLLLVGPFLLAMVPGLRGVLG